MQITLLGTGAADGWPNPFCGCASCTSERAAGRSRGQTSVLVDGTLLLDCGAETPRAAERAGIGLTGVRQVLLTHAHPDHCAPAFLLYRGWVTGAPLEVVGPEEVIAQCRQWVAPDSPVILRPVRPGQRLRVGDHEVSVLAADHAAPGGTVLYAVTGPAGRLLYATDTGPLPEATVSAISGAAFDVVLLEETFGDFPAHGTDHLDLSTFPEQVRRLRAAGALTDDTDLVAVHLSHHNPPTSELNRRLADWGARAVDDGTRLDTHRRTGANSPRTRPRRTFVLGGARSGKSREAERVLAAEADVTYVATSYPITEPAFGAATGADSPRTGANSPRTGANSAHTDWEWVARVRQHQAARPAHWRTVETLDVAALLDQEGPPLLIDCVTLWLTRVLDRHDAWKEGAWAAGGEAAVKGEVDGLVAAWRGARRRVVAVSNEVGQGLVPDTPAGRRFRDLLGWVNARLASETEDVRWCVAGRVVKL